jgi:Flp pilus assembly pilin Flp
VDRGLLKKTARNHQSRKSRTWQLGPACALSQAVVGKPPLLLLDADQLTRTAQNDRNAASASCLRWGGGIVTSRRSEVGQGMVEYSFILVLIALVVLVMLVSTGGQVLNLFSDITYTLNNEAGI